MNKLNVKGYFLPERGVDEQEEVVKDVKNMNIQKKS